MVRDMIFSHLGRVSHSGPGRCPSPPIIAWRIAGESVTGKREKIREKTRELTFEGRVYRTQSGRRRISLIQTLGSVAFAMSSRSFNTLPDGNLQQMRKDQSAKWSPLRLPT